MLKPQHEWHDEVLPEGWEQAVGELAHRDVLKALTYFADAEQEPMPSLLAPVAWDTVRQFFIREAPRLLER